MTLKMMTSLLSKFTTMIIWPRQFWVLRLHPLRWLWDIDIRISEGWKPSWVLGRWNSWGWDTLSCVKWQFWEIQFWIINYFPLLMIVLRLRRCDRGSRNSWWRSYPYSFRSFHFLCTSTFWSYGLTNKRLVKP